MSYPRTASPLENDALLRADLEEVFKWSADIHTTFIVMTSEAYVRQSKRGHLPQREKRDITTTRIESRGGYFTSQTVFI